MEREPGSHGIWTLPDGRKVFYPFGWGSSGYLVDQPETQRRIVFRYRVLSVLLWLAGIVALATDDWTVIVGYFALAALTQFTVARFITRNMTKVAEPMWLLRSLSLRAAVFPRAWLIFAFLLCCAFAVAAIWLAASGAVWVGLVGAALFAFFASCWAYMWYAKAA